MVLVKGKHHNIGICPIRFAIAVVVQLFWARHLFLHGFIEIYGLGRVPVQRPASVQSPTLLCALANQKQACIFCKRKQTALVFQKHRRLPCKRTGTFAVRAEIKRPTRAIRHFKQPLGEFDPQNPPHGKVDRGLRKPPLANRPLALVQVAEVRHIHVDPRVKRQCRRLAVVRRHTVADQLMNCSVIGNNHSLKAELFPQNFGQAVTVRADRLAVEVVEGGHHCGHARFNRLTECGQIEIVQPVIRNFRVAVVASALRRAVADKMLCTGKHAAGTVSPISLKAFHNSSCHLCADIRVLAAPLDNPSPARVAGKVQHGSKGLMHAIVCCLLRNFAVAMLYQLGVKGCCHRKRNRVNGPVPVNHIPAEEQRNSVWAFLHGNPL